MVKWRRAPASRDGTHPLGPRALELRTTARPPRGDRAAARRAGARPGRGAEAVRRGHRAAPRGTRAADRRRGAGEAGAVGPGWPSQGRGLRRLTAPSRSTSWTPAPAWMRPSKPGAATVAGFHMVALGARVLDAGMAALDLEPARRRTIALELFRAAGAGGMIGGQALDLEAEGRRLPAAQLEDVHRRKTGALIAAACVIGGLAAGAPAGACEALRGYGADVGLAFQIYDDVLDATATSDQLGKTAGKDAAFAKSTFVTLLGVGAARAEAERLAARAVDRLRQAGLVSPTLAELAHYIVTRPN